MSRPLNHSREYIALCASQLPAANVSPYLKLAMRSYPQACYDTGRPLPINVLYPIAPEFPGNHGRGQF